MIFVGKRERKVKKKGRTICGPAFGSLFQKANTPARGIPFPSCPVKHEVTEDADPTSKLTEMQKQRLSYLD